MLNLREQEAREDMRRDRGIQRKAEALARLLKKAQRVQYNTSTKTLTAFFNDRGGFMCRGEVAERVRALIACEEVEG